ncbi:MAG: ATP-binding cassette domain-containing protein [Spirochaetaceae bacterium]|nr:ATP-binding cassette domain-containing protein [Spirochaetaceae bacterium]
MSIIVSIKKRLSPLFTLEAEFETGRGCLGILGASGSGKSMTLKCIAGIEAPDAGRITVHGKTLFDSRRRINLRPQARKVGCLFQHYALFPAMTVMGNITAAMTGPPRENRRKAQTWIGRLGLGGLEGRYPSQLSGGQQQRAALARMLAQEPDAVLLDEPFSALDYPLREATQLELLETLERFGEQGGSILVTHSRDEAYRLCQDLVVMDKGRVADRGPMKALFQDPSTVQSAVMTGCKNISPAKRTGPRSLFALNWGLELRTSRIIGPHITHTGIRAHDLAPLWGKEDLMRPPFYNRVRPLLRRCSEEPFERTLLFTNARARTLDESGEIWWKRPKMRQGLPAALFFPPEAVLLLR